MDDCKIFEEDVVTIIDRDGKTEGGKIKCGLVLESSEYISSDEDDDDDKNSVYQKVRRNTVRVAWHPDGKSQVVEESKLTLSDRSLMPGEIVRRLIQGQDSQRGYVTRTKIKCHLQVIGRPIVICNVDSSDLIPLYPIDIESGDVYLDSWVGRVEKITERVVLRFCDGARCELNNDDLISELISFEDLLDKRDKDSEFSLATFYVGQILRGELGLLDGATWLKSTKNFSKATTKKNSSREVVVTVEKAELGSVEVNWLCRGYTKLGLSKNGLNPPPTEVTGKDLLRMKQLNCFQASSVQLGDNMYYVLKETDNKISINGSKFDNGSVFDFVLKKLNKQSESVSERSRDSCSSQSGEVAGNQVESSHEVETSEQSNGTSVSPNEASKLPDVNGRVSNGTSGLPNGISGLSNGTSGLPNGTSGLPNGTSGLPNGSIVRKKRKAKSCLQTRHFKKKNIKPSKPKLEDVSFHFTGKAGDQVSVEIISTSTVVDVTWQDGTSELDIPSKDLFPIHHLDELEFFPGDFVTNGSPDFKKMDVYGVVQSVDHTGRTCKVLWMRHNNAMNSTEVLETAEVSVYDIKEHPDLRFRPGNVIVRVGGFEDFEQCSEPSNDNVLVAAGQIYELSCDGNMLVQWADDTRTRCYPFQLYLVGDELSDLDSSESSSDSDEDDSEDDRKSEGSAGSWEWETEEEETLPVDTEINEKLALAVSNTNRESRTKAEQDEANQFLETVQITLHKLEESLQPQSSSDTAASGTTAHHGRDVLHLYRDCRNLDRVLMSSYFESPELTEAITELRKGLKKDKMHLLNRQVLELFESNCKQLKASKRSSNESNSIDGTSNVTDSGTDSGVGKSPSSIPSSIDNLTELTAGFDNVEQPSYSVATDTPNQSIDKSTNTDLTTLSELVTNISKPADVDGKGNNPQVLCRLIIDILKRVMLGENGLLHSFCNVLLDASRVDTDSCFGKLPKSECMTTTTGDCLTAPSVEPMPPSHPDLPPSTLDLPQDLNHLEPGISVEDVILSESDECLLPQTPVEIRSKIEFNIQGYNVIDTPPDNHHYKSTEHQPVDMRSFMGAVKKELKLLQTCLPKGIYVKGYDSRLDLFTVMIRGPSRTPYEDGLFFFDVQLPADYPKSPPLFFYISYCTDRLNPNLYEDGKVCVSLLGTWSGKGTEVWNSSSSNLLQVLISIQALILNQEPYYNEAGYERQKGSQQGLENSRMYNEMVIVKLIQSMTRMIGNPCRVFEEEIKIHMVENAYKMIDRMTHWLEVMPTVSGASTCLTPVKVKTSSKQIQNGNACSESVATTASCEGGIIKINDAVVPYVVKEDARMVPLSIATNVAGLLVDDAGRKMFPNEEECKFLNNLCITAELTFDFTSSTELVELSLLTTTSSQKPIIVELPVEKAVARSAEVEAALPNEPNTIADEPLACNHPSHTDISAVSDTASNNFEPNGDVCEKTHEDGLPDFPLLPVSKGLKLSLSSCLGQFKTALKSMGISDDRSHIALSLE